MIYVRGNTTNKKAAIRRLESNKAMGVNSFPTYRFFVAAFLLREAIVFLLTNCASAFGLKLSVGVTELADGTYPVLPGWHHDEVTSTCGLFAPDIYFSPFCEPNNTDFIVHANPYKSTE